MKFKKILAVLCAFVVSLCFCSCGNESLGFGNYNFYGCHMDTGSGDPACVKLSSWHNNEVGIEVKMQDGNSLFLSEGTYILWEDYCPICRANGE